MIEWIADISSNHCGSLEKAYKLINGAKESGATIAKFQYWNTKRFINKKAFKNFKIGHQKDWGLSVYDTYKKYEIPLKWMPKLKRCCEENTIEFMVSCYDLKSVDYIDQFVNRWKIGSGDINYIPILKKIAKKNKQVFLGCGASNFYDIVTACAYLNDTVLFLCNTNYSSDDDENIKYLNLNRLSIDYNYNFYKFQGLSDHTKDNDVIKIAIAKGVKYIERHFKIDDNTSPDNNFSLNPSEWKEMIEDGNKALIICGDSEIKVQDNEKLSRCIQRRDNKNWIRPDMEYFDNYLIKHMILELGKKN